MAKEIEIPEGYEARIDGNKAIIEQKEVDIEKEIVSICETYGITKYLDAELGPLDIKDIALHFYELGLNARKEETK